MIQHTKAKAEQERKRYQAEITLKDVCRGGQARELFEYGESSNSRRYEELVGEDMERLIARRFLFLQHLHISQKLI